MSATDDAWVGRLAVTVLTKYAASAPEWVNFEAAEKAMELAALAARFASLPDWPTCLAAHAAARLIADRDEILIGGQPELNLQKLRILGFTYIEGCALQLAMSVIEALRKDSQANTPPNYDTLSNTPAVLRFRDALRAFDRTRSGPVAMIVAALEELAAGESVEVTPLPWWKRLIDDLKQRWRLAFTFVLVLTVAMAAAAVCLPVFGYSIVADNDLGTAQAAGSTPTPASTDTSVDPVYRGPRLPNAQAQLSVYLLDSPPADVRVGSGRVPFLPGQPVVARLGQTLAVELSLSRRDSQVPADRSLKVSIGTEPGTEIIGGRTVLFNEAHSEKPAPVPDLDNTFTAVTLDENDVPTVIKFEVRIADPSEAEPASFFCGYNLRPIRAFLTAGDLPPVVTTFPFYVLRECQ